MLPQFEELPRSPLSITDLIGSSFRIFRKHYRFFFSIFFLPAALFSFSQSSLNWSAEEFRNAGAGASSSIFMIASGLVFALYIPSSWLYAQRIVAVIKTIVEPESDFQSAVEYARKRQWASYLFCMTATWLPIVELVIGAAISFAAIILFRSRLPHELSKFVAISVGFEFGGTITVVFSFTILYVYIAICLLASRADLSVPNILRQAVTITKQTLLRGGSYYSLFQLLITVIAIIFLFPTYLAAQLSGIGWARSDSLHAPLVIIVISKALGVLSYVLSSAVSGIGAGLYYNDWRYRKEGLDLKLRLATVQKSERS